MRGSSQQVFRVADDGSTGRSENGSMSTIQPRSNGVGSDGQNDYATGRTSKTNELAECLPQGFEGFAHSWSDPDWSLFDDRRGELPEFPIDCLAPPWRVWLEGAAHGAGVTPGHIAMPLLGVASSLIGMARCVRVTRSWSEPMTLWTCLVAPSGDRKTPALKVTLRALDLIERNDSAAINTARLAHETRIQKSRQATRKWSRNPSLHGMGDVTRHILVRRNCGNCAGLGTENDRGGISDRCRSALAGLFLAARTRCVAANWAE